MRVCHFALLVGAFAMAGCVSDTSRVKMEIERLVKERRYDDARDFRVKTDPAGLTKTAEEKMKDYLIETLVKPEEAKFVANSIKTLRERVLADLEKGDDVSARKYIYEFGTIAFVNDTWYPQPTANGLVYAAKIGFLNSRVNPAAYKRIRGAFVKAVSDAIAAEDFQKAYDLIAALKSVPAYPDIVDPTLAETAEEAVRQRCEREGVEKLIATLKGDVYRRFAFRAGYEKTEFEPDWEKVEAHLVVVRDALVNDDMSLATARTLVRMLLDGIKTLFNDDETGENLTTAQLNDLLADLRADMRVRLNVAIEAKLSKAAAEEAARLRKIQLALAAQSLAEVNVQSRIAAFTAAICDRVEPDINRVLGDGARVLRRCAAGRSVSAADATSLLVAATYMDFADVAKLALVHKANINGVSSKDLIGRTSYLVALQYRTGTDLADILAKADRKIRDARGYGAVHYAVRYADGATLLNALDLGLDARTAAKDGVTPLMLAAQLDNLPAVSALVPFSNVNALDGRGYSALLCAARIGSLPIVKALLSAGADIKAKSKDGDTALDLAVMLPAEDVIDYLLDEKRVAPTERAVLWCVTHGKVLPLTKLVAHGGAINDQHLALAVGSGHLDMVKYLVSLGCDVNAASVKNAIISPDSLTCTGADAIRARGVAAEIASILEYLYSQGYRE